MYKHILIATDGSEIANSGVDHGLKLAKSLGATATLVTVTEHWSATAMTRRVQSGGTEFIAENERLIAESAENTLSTAMDRAREHQVEATPLHIKNSLPAEGLLQAAKETGADLIVMASHGRRGLRRVLLGSQASEVLANATIPVLIIR